MVSPTYISALVIVISAIFAIFNIDISKVNLVELLTAIFTLVSGIIVLVRRFQKGDINIAGFRKPVAGNNK